MSETEPTQSQSETGQYEQIHKTVAAEFTIEESFIEYNTPTFYVSPQPNLKKAFLRLYKQLDSKQLVPFLRKRENRLMLQIVHKPPVKPSRAIINLVLLIATIGTTLVTGYLLSGATTNPWIDAVMFTAALLSILGAHEMGHKLTANRHRVEATYPYFIPGIPPLPTFGAVIQQKSLPPNKDTLFDLGFSGPVIGFVVAVVVSIIGITMSSVSIVSELPPGSFQTPLMLDFLANVLLRTPPVPVGQFPLLELHPLAFAGYIGLVVTMLNLIPIGQLDGGHISYVFLGDTSLSAVLSFVAIIFMLFISWPMAIIAYLVSRVKHPGSLDGVSKLSPSRKLATIILIVIFILSVAPIASILDLF